MQIKEEEYDSISKANYLECAIKDYRNKSEKNRTDDNQRQYQCQQPA